MNFIHEIIMKTLINKKERYRGNFKKKRVE